MVRVCISFIMLTPKQSLATVKCMCSTPLLLQIDCTVTTTNQKIKFDHDNYTVTNKSKDEVSSSQHTLYSTHVTTIPQYLFKLYLDNV